MWLCKTFVRKHTHKESDPSLSENKEESNFLEPLNRGHSTPPQNRLQGLCKFFVNFASSLTYFWSHHAAQVLVLGHWHRVSSEPDWLVLWTTYRGQRDPGHFRSQARLISVRSRDRSVFS
jgi:hypothetical protein